MHFAAQFRAAIGYRPHEYLLFCRIDRAKDMLADADAPLVEVALSVGFQSQAHFSTVFKRLTGHTPAQWRRANAETAASAPTPALTSRGMAMVRVD
jgi:transcriptional regulator GlxA family with amidase domain